MGKGGGGGGNNTTTGTTYNTNIPEYARPYVETMLGATQKQLFQGNDTGGGGFEITGFKPYQAYGGTYDDQGNQLSYDPSKAIAGFSPLQQQYQAGTAALQTPGQFQDASGITGAGIMGAMGTAGQAQGLNRMGMQAAQAGNQYAQQATNPYAMSAYMSPYMQNVVDVQQQGAERMSQMQQQQNNAAAVGAGAFGGSRQALVEAERQRNLLTQKDAIQAQGLQSAFQNAQQAQQYAANLGLQGQQAGAGMIGQGIGAQQAAYGQAMQGAGQLGTLGGQQLAAQQSILDAQNKAGAQQQAYQQQVINQAMTDYANAQQYPLMQLGTMSNMLRGLPMQAQTTSQYAAAPNAVTQGIGAAGAIGSLMQASKAEGGVIKSMASGGITSIPSYEIGGAVKADLEDMDIDGLQRQIKESSSPRVKQMAQEILVAKRMAQAPGKAGGGIIAFAEGDQVEDKLDGMQLADAVQARDPRVVSDSDGILMADAKPRAATPAPVTPAPVTPAPAAPATAVAPAVPPVQPPQSILGNIQKDLAGHQATANKSMEDIMAERQALREKLGVGGDAPREELRASAMAERANLKDEAERQRHLRLAEFFASWGSTPGSTLAAGMNALKKTIPGMVEDKKEAKKLQRESDKIIYDIDQATRLEKLGRIDEATALKEKAATHAQDINKSLLTYQSQQETANKHLEGEKIRAGSAAADRAANRDAANDRKTQDQYLTSIQRHTNVLSEIAQEKNGKEYLALTKQAQMPATVKGPAATMRDDAIAKLNVIEQNHKDRIAEANRNVEYYAGRAGVPKNEAKKDDAPPKAEPAKVEVPSWIPPELASKAKLAGDGNWYVPNGNKGYRKIVKE